MIALVGFIMIALIVVLLLKGKMSPIVVLALIPTVAALILGYNPKDVAGFIKEGIGTTITIILEEGYTDGKQQLSESTAGG